MTRISTDLGKVVLASRNRGKAVELNRILAPLGIQVVCLDQVGVHEELPETGETFEHNALQKAGRVVELCGLAAIADDSGLEVDALDGAPGVYSARFAGEYADDAANNALLLQKLAGLPRAQRGARFVCVAALVEPHGRELTARGECRGVIVEQPRGAGGFGYDPLFEVPELGLTFAQLDAEQKDRISHRGRAFRELAQRIAQR
ncbi:MAG: XTP/dITP diphosphatase [Candidatus Alcyoniella australis]|nr:XTP/dITP diphosphatase [Candidatus Alcyoniella australis]